MKNLFLFLFLIISPLIFSQSLNRAFYLGSNVGGPAPNVMADSSYAKLKHGLNLGYYHVLYKKNGSGFSISGEMAFQFSQLQYGQKIQKDTTVQVQIPMQNGNMLTTNINTYYKADVNGGMKLNMFKVGSNFNYVFKKYTFTLGTYLNYFGGGYDKGTVDVTIGEGGVAGLEDFKQYYSNTSGINRFTFDILMRTERQIYQNFGFALQLTRGITPFYNRNLDIMGQQMKFYNTFVGMQFTYNFL